MLRPVSINSHEKGVLKNNQTRMLWISIASWMCRTTLRYPVQVYSRRVWKYIFKITFNRQVIGRETVTIELIVPAWAVVTWLQAETTLLATQLGGHVKGDLLPLYSMNNDVLLWGDWLSCDPLRGPHDSQSPHIKKHLCPILWQLWFICHKYIHTI